MQLDPLKRLGELSFDETLTLKGMEGMNKRECFFEFLDLLERYELDLENTVEDYYDALNDHEKGLKNF